MNYHPDNEAVLKGGDIFSKKKFSFLYVG